jgi:hypothetical protein
MLEDRIQFVTIKVAEGRYAGKKAVACGDKLLRSAVSRLIQDAARANEIGYTKSDVEVSFDTGWSYRVRFDIVRGDTVYSLLRDIDDTARYYTSKDVGWAALSTVDGFTRLLSTPQYNS